MITVLGLGRGSGPIEAMVLRPVAARAARAMLLVASIMLDGGLDDSFWCVRALHSDVVSPNCPWPLFGDTGFWRFGQECSLAAWNVVTYARDASSKWAQKGTRVTDMAPEKGK